jgi:carbonic anhydrase
MRMAILLRSFLGPVCAVIMLVLSACSPAVVEHRPHPATPDDALKALIDGNARFISNHPRYPDQTLEHIRALEKGQHPFAIIVTCADSRVAPELIFDQGFGDLFVIRNAGNLVGDYELGSIEYAVEHLHVPLVMVLGHESCGAVKAFVDHEFDSLPNHMQRIVDYIKAEDEMDTLVRTSGHFYEDAILCNVDHGVHTITASEPILAEFVRAGKLKVVGANYDLGTGKVVLVEH